MFKSPESPVAAPPSEVEKKAREYSQADFEGGKVDKFCDLVMKGGITSGVIYPAAVLELAKRYRFRAIGGASAGAIAAAGAAAAECGRARNGGGKSLNGSSFVALQKLSQHMAGPNVLLRLFRPSYKTKAYFQIFLDILDGVPAAVRVLHFVIVPALVILSSLVAFCLIYMNWRPTWGVRQNWIIALSLGAANTLAFLLIWNGMRIKARQGSRSWHRGWLDKSGWRITPTYSLVGFAAGVFLISCVEDFDSNEPWALLLRPLAVFGGSAIATIPLATVFYVLELRQRGKILAKSDFGVATAHDPSFVYSPSPAGPIELDVPLTDYVFANLNHMAGLNGPNDVLTFKDLKEAKVYQVPTKPGEPERYEGITLRLMTSNLSLQRPYTFPLVADTFLFKRSEFELLFPATVVDWMTRHQPVPPPFPIAVEYAKELFYLPPADDQPVIVAVRISLSHPGLFSAVPLYAITQAYLATARPAGQSPSVGAAVTPLTATDRDIRRTLFSDGGIVSNFPIHMFDRWFPDAPTFGINLADSLHKSGDQVDETYLVCPREWQANRRPAQPDAVHLPPADESPVAEWRDINSIGALASAIFYTAKNHRMNSQTELPGYRERIVTVRLTEDEGGLNLNMPPKTVEDLVDFGVRAGQVLVASYANGDGLEDHQWVRLRVVLTHLEREFRLMQTALQAPPGIGGPPLPGGPIVDLLNRAIPPGRLLPFPPPNAAAVTNALTVLQQLFGALHLNFPTTTQVFDWHPPKMTPEPIKRMVPTEGDEAI